MTGFGMTSTDNNVVSGDRDCRPGANISDIKFRIYSISIYYHYLQITAEQKELRGMYSYCILYYILYYLLDCTQDEDHAVQNEQQQKSEER